MNQLHSSESNDSTGQLHHHLKDQMSKEDRPQQKNKSLRSTLESDKHVCLSCKKDDQQLLNIGENMNLNGECGQKVNKSNDQHEFNDGEHKSNDGEHKSNDDLLLMKRSIE